MKQYIRSFCLKRNLLADLPLVCDIFRKPPIFFAEMILPLSGGYPERPGILFPVFHGNAKRDTAAFVCLTVREHIFSLDIHRMFCII